MLKIFLESYKKSLPPVYNKLITNLQAHPNLIIHHPIIATPAFHPMKIRIKTSPQSNSIPKGRSIFWVSAAQSFCSQQLVGASGKDKLEVNNFLSTSAEKYEMLKNQDMKGLFRILIQIYANETSMEGEMPLHYFSNLLMNEINQDPKAPNNTLNRLGLQIDFEKYEKYIKSHHLKNLLKSNENILNTFYQMLCSTFIKVTNQVEFKRLLKLTRAQIRQVNEHSVVLRQKIDGPNKQTIRINTLAPLLPSLNHSFNPNCVVVGKYFTHLKQSFYCVESLREIRPGEELCVQYRKNMNNYEKLLRMGYKELIQNCNNVDNEYILIINLIDPQIPEVQQIMSGDIDEKKDVLTKFQLKMKNIIKITQDGYIKQQDLKMLRILFGIVDDKQISAENYQCSIDAKIYHFIAKFVQPSLSLHINQRKLDIRVVDKEINQQIVKAFRIIEEGEIQILSKFMEKVKINVK